MSKIILGWQLNDAVPERRVRETIAAIKERYQPLFRDRIGHAGIWHQNQGLLQFDVPRAPDPNCDVEANRLICLTGKPTITSDGSVFRTKSLSARFLYDELFSPADVVNERLIHEINPPFTLSWFDKSRQQLVVIHDGLGADQFFVSATSTGVVFSNRCWPVLKLLGESPRVDLDAWKYWFCMGWFPTTSTPFHSIRCLDRGEIVRGDSRSVAFSTADTFSSWIGPEQSHGSSSRVTEAMHSVEQLIRVNQPDGSPYAADLTGGLDSRAICSVLMSEAMPCRFFTSGNRFSADVILAGRIAKHFHLDWVHVKGASATRQEARSTTLHAQFRKMLLWGEGLVEPGRFRHFGTEARATNDVSYLSGGSSEISKGQYYGRVLRKDGAALFLERVFLEPFERIQHERLPNDGAFDLTGMLRDQFSKGAAYGVEGFSLLDYFYLTERTRRWQSAHLAINLFDVSVLPFLNVEHIKLAFAMAPRDKAHHAFQTFIIANNAEQLLRIPLNDDLYRNPLYSLLRLIPRIKSLVGCANDLGSADWFRRDGRQQIERMFSRDTPLWEILDKQKTKNAWNAFLRNGSEDARMALELLSFHYWHDLFIDAARPDS